MKNTLPRNSLIADGGFWVALGNKKDRYHEAAITALDTFENSAFVVTWPVIAEASHLLYNRVDFQAQLLFWHNIEQGGADIFHLDEAHHLSRVRELMLKYRDLPMDLADASLVILAEELGHGRILSTDERDFNSYRWKNREPFENLLLPNT
ncbi:hypothetical protein VSS37_13030 [Candidatus Thiothrix sp. Deng01]|uniref:PIN domain-containing protein n=1 Tax=Candidatus Thiothrix phosphatis TaxID=3112415 RepID=A0ABU6CYK3_9GAMM|nr:hypothetical protein [Candidatus Thiothrix sp. Deng01]MEB4591909.1 hypothetical protein [Candidatus Thiothrix sp. Deng01]